MPICLTKQAPELMCWIYNLGLDVCQPRRCEAMWCGYFTEMPLCVCLPDSSPDVTCNLKDRTKIYFWIFINFLPISCYFCILRPQEHLKKYFTDKNVNNFNCSIPLIIILIHFGFWMISEWLYLQIVPVFRHVSGRNLIVLFLLSGVGWDGDMTPWPPHIYIYIFKVRLIFTSVPLITSPPEGIARYCFDTVCVSGQYFGILFLGY